MPDDFTLNDLGYYGPRNPIDYDQQDAPEIRRNGRVLRALAHIDKEGYEEHYDVLTDYDR